MHYYSLVDPLIRVIDQSWGAGGNQVMGFYHGSWSKFAFRTPRAITRQVDLSKSLAVWLQCVPIHLNGALPVESNSRDHVCMFIPFFSLGLAVWLCWNMTKNLLLCFYTTCFSFFPFIHLIHLAFLDCGINHKKERIVGGQDTTIENSPWQCSLQYMGQHSCGCSIITPQIILTAAHCFPR